MTPQEAQMLQDLVRKVEGTALTEKDPDAEALLQDGLGRDPDAIYKLAQTVLIQNIALEQARTQMERMQRQLSPPQQPPVHSTSFLGDCCITMRRRQLRHLRHRLRNIRRYRHRTALRDTRQCRVMRLRLHTEDRAADFCVRQQRQLLAWRAGCWRSKGLSR